MEKFDFCGWATKNDLQCSDGRVIRRDAFKHNDGQTVPLVWNHDHTDPYRIIGHALLENRDEGVYAYGKFNDSDLGKTAKLYVEHGDITQLSIYANQLKQQGPNVLHGAIREVSLVMAGANPGAFIESVMSHSDGENEEEAIIYTGEDFYLYHSDEKEEKEDDGEETIADVFNTLDDKQKKVVYYMLQEALKAEKAVKHADESGDKTVEDVFDTLTDEQKNLVYAIIAKALDGDMSHSDEEDENAEEAERIFNTLTDEQKDVVYYMVSEALENGDSDDEEDIEHSDEDENSENDDDNNTELTHSEGGNNTMKENVFDQAETRQTNVLSHADQEAIIAMAKQSNVGSLKQAVKLYADEKGLAHSEDGFGVFEDYGVLFPELELLKKGEPETLWKNDQTWVGPALRKIHKSPFSRIRTRHADARIAELKAKGYQKKGDEKTLMGQITMINRETTPQTIYIKDNLHRDDIIDITDFSIVDYQWRVMRTILDETMVLSAMVGDGREFGDPDKISEEHIRPIWKDDEEYTIHWDVDIAAAEKELQGTDTDVHFGENYIYAEAIITAALYSREKFKGTGTPDFYCTPHLVNVMLLARDLNGRRIYDSKADLAKALNCNAIVEVEQFEGLQRETKDGKKKELLGLFVNLNDYTFGSTRGGEITKFEDFDMDFNLKKFMLETRLSGSLYKLKSAIALELPVAAGE